MDFFIYSCRPFGKMFLIAALGLWLAAVPAPAATSATASDVVPVAGTTWKGRVGDDAVSFEFKRDGTLIMTGAMTADALSPMSVRGTWKQEGHWLHLVLPQFTFKTNIRDNTFSGKTLVRGLCTYIGATREVAAAMTP